MSTPTKRVLRTLALLTVLPASLTLAGCSGEKAAEPAASSTTTKTTTSTASPTTMASSISDQDTWAKASESGMSAAFGSLKNNGTNPVVITGAVGDAGPMQLHVTTKNASGEMEMKETSAFTLPPGGTLTLAPGGSHLMYMNLTKALKAGDTQHLTVTFKDGSTAKLDFPVRAYDGAKEKYHGSSPSMDRGSSAEHSDHPSHSEHAASPSATHSH